MPSLPVMLDIHGKRCVVVGGGPVALRRVRALLEAGGQVTVIAPTIEAELTGLAIQARLRPYRQGDLDGAWLVIIASNDTQVNETAADDAGRAHILINRADDPGAGDFVVPAHAHHGPVTLAAHTGGVSPAAAAAIRKTMSDALDPDWPILLTQAAAFRPMIQERFAAPDERRARLRKLADPQALAILKQRGEAALLDHYRALIGPDS
jgi:precorrin-2 dehydrogenase/sirohydrochlorin ferrochelatase